MNENSFTHKITNDDMDAYYNLAEATKENDVNKALELASTTEGNLAD